jgi:SpoVK/Ycf46/Vps4 family AAA+-type ATPase
VFALARRLSPCVVFLDEIDALFGARMAARESGGAATAHRGVITEFMQEMDGLKSSKEDGIIVIGATNRPFDLDDAVLRRLPRRLLVDLPGEKERGGLSMIIVTTACFTDRLCRDSQNPSPRRGPCLRCHSTAARKEDRELFRI